jgi:insertion element IS1 protein InsB
LHPDDVDVVIRQAAEAEVDEMWSFTGKKKDQRWLWHAIDHRNGKVLAYVFGRRKDEVFVKLKTHVQGVRLNHTIFPREERPTRVCDCMAL